MAERLTYVTQPAPRPSARDELEELIEILSDSGALRTAKGLVGRFAQVTEVALDGMNSSSGRSMIGSIALMADCLGKLPAEKLAGISRGVEKGVARAGEVMRDDPPSALQLLRMTRDPDTRRAFGALLGILNEIGRALAESEGEDTETR